MRRMRTGATDKNHGYQDLIEIMGKGVQKRDGLPREAVLLHPVGVADHADGQSLYGELLAGEIHLDRG